VFLSIDLPKEMNDYSFADRTGYVEMTEADIKRSHLRMLQKLHKVCTEHGLRYFMCGGTLLGAVRHKGYIPWDDDIDVVMPMPDIIRLAEVLREDEAFSLISFADDVDYFDTCSLMVDNSTVCDFNGFMQLTSGVSIDIFPFSGVPEEEAAQRQYLEQMKELEMNKWNKLYNPQECKTANQQLVDYMLSFEYDKSSTIGYVLSRYFVRDIFPRYYFDETVQLEFEGLMLNAPKYWHEYLTKLMGDYMTLPPVEKRVGVHYYKAYYKK
jgi:lipopolysaccharide cholinephosphotransferase